MMTGRREKDGRDNELYIDRGRRRGRTERETETERHAHREAKR